jgi:hypothetical protein
VKVFMFYRQHLNHCVEDLRPEALLRQGGNAPSANDRFSHFTCGLGHADIQW